MMVSLRRLLATALVAATTLTMPSLALATDLTSGGGFLFDVQDAYGGYLSNGSIDAYDGCYYLSVGGTTYSPSGAGTLSADGRTVTLRVATLAGLQVQRFVYVPASGGDWARFADVLQNTSSTAITTTVRINGNLGSDSATRLMATSSGGASVSTNDAWFATDDTDGSGDPSLVHFLQGGPSSGALVNARAVSQVADNIEWTFDVTVPAGERVVFLTFALQGNSQASVQAEAARLMDMPDDAWTGLEDYETEIVNFPARTILTSCAGARVGARCDDGLFCTRLDRCTAAGTCVGTGDPCNDGNACTVDTCDEATDSCRNEMTPDRCLIGGECVAHGLPHPSYPCLYCDPDANAHDWTPRAEGTSCGAAACTAGRVIPEATCSATGRCIVPPSEPCAAGACADGASCASTCGDDCPGDSYCGPSGRCERPRANGSSCANDEQCSSGHCVDRICCNDACTGTCRSCGVADAVGRCTNVPAMTDPDLECAGGFCNGAGACSIPDAGVPATPDAGPRPDAGAPTPDAAVARDAALGIDAATPPEPPSDEGGGCSAQPGAERHAPSTILGLLLGLAVWARRRR